MKLFCWKTDQPDQSVKRSSVSAPKETRDDGDDEGQDDFPEIDHISLYTLRIYIILGIPMLLSAAYTLSYVFTAGTVSYRCLAKDCEDPGNTTLYPSWLPNAIPYTDGSPTTCTRYTVQNATESCSTTVFTEEIESCDAWVYDPEELTILNQWDLTCDNNLWKLTLVGTINNVAQFVGLIFCGYLSDKYGRRNVLAISTFMSSIFGLIRVFSVNYEMFIIFEFLDALAATAIYSSGFVLGMEFVGPKKRILVSNLMCCMYAFGEIILAFCAMWLRSWRLLILVFSVPGFLVISIPWLVPESVRWLMSKGRIEEAETVLCKLAAANGVELSEKSISIIRNSEKNLQDKKSQEEFKSPVISPAKQVLSNKLILLRLLTCCFCWTANTFVYFGLSLLSVSVPGNKYINFALVALVEIPAQLLTWIMVDYVGRKWTLSSAFFLSGLFCIVAIFVPDDWWYLPLIVFLGGKLCIAVAFSSVYICTAEMFPTPLRHSLLGFCSMIARIGSMIAPQMPLLKVYMDSLPLMLFGIVAIVAGMLSLTFPETVGIKLPDTIEEAINIGKSKKRTTHNIEMSTTGVRM